MRHVLGPVAAFLLSYGFGGPCLLAQSPDAKPTATPLGATVRPVRVDLISLQVTKLPRDEFGNGKRPGTEETVSFWLANSGTVLDLRVKLGRPIARFDAAASRLLRFADDKGGDLTRPPDGRKIDRFFENNKPIRVKLDANSDGGEVILLGYGTPTPGATRLGIDADLVFLAGSGERTAEREGVEPRLGTTVEVGPLRLTFKDPKQVGGVFGPAPGGGDGDAMQVAVSYERVDKLIKAVEWLDADGKAVGTIEGAFFDGNRGGTVTTGVPRMDRIGVRVVYYEKSEAITVPLRLETGVGF